MERIMQMILLITVVLPAVTATWSPWEAWGMCSRTCGIGASLARRHCVGSLTSCPGNNIRYRTCNTEDCPTGTTDFRTKQCANAMGHNDTYVWTPDIPHHVSPCALYCRAQGTNIVKLMTSKVVDGTSCYQTSDGICIDGRCQVVGCDRQLNSEKKEDICGVCGGNGTSCRLVTGLYRSKPEKSRGSEVVITVPQNSRHISVSARGLGHVGLKLHESVTVDMVTPNMTILTGQTHLEKSKLVINYTKLSYGKEYFAVPGPVPEDIEVLALYDDIVWKYIRYEFYRPLTVMWIHNEESVVCTKSCGNGLRFIWPVCVNVANAERQDKKLCEDEGITAPAPKVYRCNTNPCPTELCDGVAATGPQGRRGEQLLVVQKSKQHSSINERIDFAFEDVRGPRWQPDPWTDCSASCNGGFQTRSFSCTEDDDEGRTFISVDSSPCQRAGLTPPSTRRRCNEQSCPRWIHQTWSACSVTCGTGWQHRVVLCLGHNAKPGYGCEVRKKPITRQACLVRRACIRKIISPVSDSEEKLGSRNAAFRGTVKTVSLRPSWVPGEWGECSTSCGTGVMERKVKCQVILEFTELIEILDDSHCNETKPNMTQICSLGECIGEALGARRHQVVFNEATPTGKSNSDIFMTSNSESSNQPSENIATIHDSNFYQWKYENYSSCTPPCDQYNITIRWKCYHKTTLALVSPENCDPSLKLSPFCDNTSCIPSPLGGGRRWDLGPFSPCSVTCGRGTQNRSVVCRAMPEGLNQSDTSLTYSVQPGRRLPDIMCPAPKPLDVQACAQSSCHPQWKVSSWSKCTSECGRGLQNRSVTCMQKLGSGETVQVSDMYCLSNLQPKRQRTCTSRRNCPQNLSNGSRKPCQALCESNIQRRFTRCMRNVPSIRAASRKTLRICHAARRKGLTMCRRRKCSLPSNRPKIYISHQTFVQEHPQSKVRIQIGQRATVLRGTTIIIKCKVESFLSGRIIWFHNRSLIGFGSRIVARNKKHVAILSDGSLRVLRARLSDSGVYVCRAGPAFARSMIRVRLSNSVVIPKNRFPTSLNFQGTRSNEIPENVVNSVGSVDKNFDSFDGMIRRYRPSSVKFAEAPRQIVHPDISYAQASRVVQTKLIATPDTVETILTSSHGSDNTSASNQQIQNLRRDSELIAIVQQYLEDTDLERPHDQINEVLKEFISITDDYHKGRIGLNERIRRNVEVYEQLNSLMVNTDERVGSRLNTARSTETLLPLRIVRLLEEQIRNETFSTSPLIISHPTPEDPIQQDRDVTAYVGGSLTITHAERVTILCETFGNLQPDVTWYRDGSQLPDNPRFFVLQEGSLRIMRPQYTDTGTYTCVASNSHGSDSKTISLSVMRKPRIRSITISHEDLLSDVVHVTVGSDIQAKLGAKIIIQCPTQGTPDPFVVWSKDGPGLGQNTMVLADNSLQIYPATAAYQGLFGCEASNPAGSDYQASSLVLLDAPHLADDSTLLSEIEGVVGLPQLLQAGTPPETYHVKANTSVIMGCPITGFPQPLISWSFNNQSLINLGPILDYQLMKQGRILQIPNSGDETVGTYTCHATNDAGNFTASLELDILVYTYEYGEYSECSASCGSNGVQYKLAKCTRDGSIGIDDWYCKELEKPAPKMKPCNRIDCPPGFVPGRWSVCSTNCGNGTRTRAPSCVVVMSNGSTREVANVECSHDNISLELESCHEQLCPRWRSGPWSPCNRRCVKRGLSIKSRQIQCLDGNGTKLHKKHCSGEAVPRSKAYCRLGQCYPVWLAGRWSSCSKSCGTNGFRTRAVKCVYKGRRHQLATNQCVNRRKPATKLACSRTRCPKNSCTDQSWCPRVLERLQCNTRLRKLCCRSCSS